MTLLQKSGDGSVSDEVFNPVVDAVVVLQHVPPGSQDVLQTDPIPVSSAQILTIDTVPVELVAAPGAGFALVPIWFTWVYLAGATPYDQDYTFNVDWDGDSSGLISLNGALLRAENRLSTSAGSTESRKTFAVSENKALVLHGDSPAPVDGNGTGLAQVTYIVTSLSA